MRYPAKLLKTIVAVGMSLFLLPVLVTPAAAQTWIELAPTGPQPPDPLFVPKHAFYDAANNRLIAFFPGNPPYNPDPPGNANEVWILTNANGLGGTPTWFQLQPTGAPSFSNKMESVVYDVVHNRLIVYGGCRVSCSPALSEVFVLSNANGLGGIPVWKQSSVPNPQPRTSHTAVYDAINNLMIAFGGGLAFFGTDQNDTRVLTNANAGPSTWALPLGLLSPLREGHHPSETATPPSTIKPPTGW
jgi:hypothetical protein